MDMKEKFRIKLLPNNLFFTTISYYYTDFDGDMREHIKYLYEFGNEQDANWYSSYDKAMNDIDNIIANKYPNLVGQIEIEKFEV